MAEESEAATKSKNLFESKGLWMLIGVVAIVAGLYLSSQYNPLIFYGMLLGAAAGLLFGYTKELKGKQTRTDALMQTMVLWMVIGAVVGFVWSPLISFASPIAGGTWDFIVSQANQIWQNVNPKTDIWANPTAKETASVDVNFQNVKYAQNTNTVSFVANIVVLTPDMNMPLTVTSCTANGLPLDISPKSQFLFPRQSVQKTESIQCQGTGTKSNLKVEIERPVSIKSKLDIQIAPSSEAFTNSPSASTKAPFSLGIETKNNQPLIPGEYIFSIRLNGETDAQLNYVDSLKLTTAASSQLSFDCNGFHPIANGMQISNLDSEALKQYRSTTSTNEYVFDCMMTVSNVNKPDTAFVESEALYKVKNIYTQP